ncbi:MAG: hypothetical protein EOP51_33995 [Sphingobacteriales bacterium]|nr:MAG: hypothetical protein EOP51_33995 [Sphingobacteriales bacterium]
MKQLISVVVFGFLSPQAFAQTALKPDIEKAIDTIFKPLHPHNSPGVAVTVLERGTVLQVVTLCIQC